MRSSLWCGLAMCACVATSGCGDDETATGAGGGPPLPPGLECLGSVELPTTMLTMADLNATVIDNSTRDPIVGLIFKVCGESDAACASPLAQATTDAQGAFTVTMPTGPTGFTGYGELTAPSYIPALLRGSNPFIPDPMQTVGFGMVPIAAISILAQAFGIQADPAKGHVLIYVYACTGGFASDVVFNVEGAEVIGYNANNMVSFEATATDAGGQGFALNVTPGNVSITASLAAGGARLGSLSMHVRAGHVTQILMDPTP